MIKVTLSFGEMLFVNSNVGGVELRKYYHLGMQNISSILSRVVTGNVVVDPGHVPWVFRIRKVH